jgi:hypothetical protein
MHYSAYVAQKFRDTALKQSVLIAGYMVYIPL